MDFFSLPLSSFSKYVSGREKKKKMIENGKNRAWGHSGSSDVNLL